MGVKIADDWGGPARVTPGNHWGDENLRSHQRMAARFATYGRGKVMFVHGGGWHHWDGTRWAPDHSEAAARRLFGDLLKVCAPEALSDKALYSDLRSAMTATGTRGVLELARTHPAMFVQDTDADPYLLNCQNGTLDLHTLELRPHNPADHITKVCAAAYRPDCHGDAWDYLTTSSLPDPDVRAFLQRYAGSALIGRVIDHVLVILTGNGRNGKGMLGRSIGKALGDYSITASNEMLIDTDRGGRLSAQDLSSMYRLRGARWAVMSEIRKGAKLAEATMKTLTGGDEIEAKLMGRDKVEFQPSHSFVLLANDLPSVDPDAKAVWDRMRVVPFNVSFAGREDTTLEQRLDVQLDAVLTWCVEGLRAYQQQGLNAPAAVRAKTDDYRNENDPLGQFLADECTQGPEWSVPKGVFADAFRKWCGEEYGSITQTALGKQMKGRGIVEGKSGGTRLWRGISLNAQYGEV